MERYKLFVDACEELKNAKLIIADAKISKVLREVLACPEFVEIIGKSLVGYSFENDLKALKNDNSYGIGSSINREPYKMIALAFSLLSEIDAKKIDLQEFIDDFYAEETLADSFNRFNKEIVEPFENYLLNWVGASNLQAEEDVVEEENEILIKRKEKYTMEQLFEDLGIIFNQIRETIALDRKIKQDRIDEINITINALVESMKLKNLKIMNALVISLNYLVEPIKSVKYYNMELQNRMAEFYGIK